MNYLIKRLIVLVLFFLPLCISAQTKKQVDMEVFGNSDTTLWYKWRYELCNKLKIPALLNNTDTFHFRYWQNGQALDIWSTDGKNFNGTVSNYARTYEADARKKNKTKPEKVFTSQVKLDTALARKTFLLLQTVNGIPSDHKIKGWSQGEDGITYIFELSTPSSYAFKTFWTPSAQSDSLAEAKRINDFTKNLEKLLGLEKLYGNFTATLPNGQYSNDGFGIMIINRNEDR